MSQSKYHIIDEVNASDSSIESDTYHHQKHRLVEPQLLIQKKKNPLLQEQNYTKSIQQQQMRIKKQLDEVKPYYSEIPSEIVTSKVSSNGDYRNSDNTSKKTSKKSKKEQKATKGNRNINQQANLQKPMKKSSQIPYYSAQSHYLMNSKDTKRVQMQTDKKQINFYSNQSDIRISLPSDIVSQIDLGNRIQKKKSRSQIDKKSKSSFKRLHSKQQRSLSKPVKLTTQKNDREHQSQPITPTRENQQLKSKQNSCMLNTRSSNKDKNSQKKKDNDQKIDDRSKCCNECQIM